MKKEDIVRHMSRLLGDKPLISLMNVRREELDIVYEFVLKRIKEDGRGSEEDINSTK